MGILDSTSVVPKAKADSQNPWAGFARSTLSSIPELFGVGATPEAELYREEHKLGGLGSQLLGTAVPYAGYAKAARMVPAFEAAIAGIGNVKTAPITTKALQEVARFAPFEAGRVGIAAGINDQPLGDELKTSAINLAAGGAIAGAFGALGSMGARVKAERPLADLFKTVSPDAPLQVQLRSMAEELAATPSPLPEQLNRYNSMVREARLETPGLGKRAVGQLENDEKDLGRSLNRLFFRLSDDAVKAERENRTAVRRFGNGLNNGMGDETGWKAAATEAQLPEDFPLFGQFFRISKAGTENTARAMESQASKLIRAGAYRIGRETGDGQYVMLKQLDDKRWLSFKTDVPEKFVPEFKPWNDAQVKWQSWLPEDAVPRDAGGDGYLVGRNFKEQFPLMKYDQARKTGKIEGWVGDITGEAGKRLEDMATHLLTPAINQTARNSRANWILKGAQAVYDSAEQRVNNLMQGSRELTDHPNILAASLKGVDRPITSGIEHDLSALTDDQLAAYMAAWRKGGTAELFESGQMDEATRDLYHANEGRITELFDSLNKTRKVLDRPQADSLTGHGGIPRRWDGSIKVGLTDDDGNLIAMAAGHNRTGALKRAEEIQLKLREEGVDAKIGKEWDPTDKGTMPVELKRALSEPGFLESRSGVRGFKWDFDEMPTKEQLIGEYRAAATGRARAEANHAVEALFRSDIERLATEDPLMHKIVTERTNTLGGIQDDITRKINQLVDPVLGPMLGTGSAGKIVDAVNKGLWQLQFGFGNIAYPTLNLVGTLQTMIPELAFVMGGAPEGKMGFYTPQLMKGADGQSKGIMSVLDPLKMMARGMKQMANPEAGLMKAYAKAADEGVIDPKFIEDYAGQNSKTVGRLKDVLTGKENFGKWILAVGEVMPAASERLARSYAFTTGWDVGKHVLGLEADAAYVFAKEFVDRSMYRYATADRAAILTNPVGKLFGSMKNWVSHYLSNMMLYSGEAVRGNYAPLAWQMATTGLIGGASAIPLVPTLGNWFAEQMGEGNLMDWTYGAMNQKAGDALYFGLPAIMGTSMSSATASPIRDANMLFSFAQMDRAKAMGKAIGTAVDSWKLTGEHPARNEEVAGGLARALAPKTLYRYMQVYDNPGIKSLTTGYPVLDETSVWNKVMFASGFTPNEIERGYATFEGMLKDKEARTKALHIYGTSLAQAMTDGDSEGIDRTLRRAMIEGLDVSSVMKSAQSRMDKASKGMLERNFTDAQRLAYGNVLGERE